MRHLASLVVLAVAAAMMAEGAAVAAEPNRRAQPDATDAGIWKSYAPKDLRGEFNNYDPIGLVAGALIRTDCSINYTDPDDGKIYCFNSATSLTYFEHWPKTYARRAATALEKLEKGTPTH